MRSALSGLTIVCLCFVIFGCGASQGEAAPLFESEFDAGLANRETYQAPIQDIPAPPEPGEPLVSLPEGISRQDLNGVIDLGPGVILGYVQTDAVFENKRFVGWQIGAFTRGEPAVIDLRVGDVVLAVNGHKLERPGEFYAILQALKQASELRIDLLRKGEKQTLSYPILD